MTHVEKDSFDKRNGYFEEQSVKQTLEYYRDDS